MLLTSDNMCMDDTLARISNVMCGVTTEPFFGVWCRFFGIWCRLGRLDVKHCGKPFPITYEYAKRMLAMQQTQQGGAPFSALYAIGDNPSADSRGANCAGAPWRSVLVHTGIYAGDCSTLSVEDTATIEVPDLCAAVNRIVDIHTWQCLTVFKMKAGF